MVQAVLGHFLKLNFKNFYGFIKNRTDHKSKVPTPKQGLILVKLCKGDVKSFKVDIKLSA
jgi:hypothetical protein